MDALLLATFGEALIFVLKKIGENLTDTLLERSAEPLQQLLTRGYDEKKDQHRLRAAIEAAAKEFKSSKSKHYRFDVALQLLKSNRKLAVEVATLAVGMPSESPERVPLDLLTALKIDKSGRAAFAKFLFTLRKQLAKHDDFRAGLEYADRLEQRGLLESLLNILRRHVEIDEAILIKRRLTTDEEKALHDYLDHVRTQSQFMPLPLTRQHIVGQRIDVDANEVFVPLTLRDPQDEQLGKKDCDSGRPATFAEIFNRYPCFLLKGPPGCGKTTLLHRAAWAFASGKAPSDLQWTDRLLLPIFLRLRNFGVFLAEHHDTYIGAAHGALIAFMENQFHEEYRIALSPQFFDERLKEGRCLVLLDGLDEVATDRPEVAQYVSAFVQEYEKYHNHFVLASRPRGYDAVEIYLRRAKPAVVEVNPLNADGIRKLVENLFSALEVNSAQRARDVVELPQAILSSSKLKTMAGTPLFCAALVLVYKYGGAQLPQRRVEVYSQIIDLLLGLWKAADQGLAKNQKIVLEDGTGVVFPDVPSAVAMKKRRLSHLALWMQEHGLSDIPEQQAKDVLQAFIKSKEGKTNGLAREWAENFLNNAREFSGLFVEMESDRYAFTHQGFREYLAATALKNKRESDFISAVKARATDDWWEEVILLAGAHPELSDELRTYLIKVLLGGAQKKSLSTEKRHAFLVMAGQCAADMPGLLSDPQRDQVVEKLHAAMVQRDLDPKKRLEAGETLDALCWTPCDLEDFICIQGMEDVWIAKYPVTNRQYRRFLSSLDYADPRLWKSVQGFDVKGVPLGEAGHDAWEWFTRSGGDDVRPRFWDDALFGASRRLVPVVGVSWYEAAAYCVWLGHHWKEAGLSIPEGFSFRLPREEEWIAAVGGLYPWQKRTHAVTRSTISAYANTCESRFYRTTPVCMYPDGKNAAGIMDLNGNVWEWQANQHSLGKSEFALRGGDWTNSWDQDNVSPRISDLPGACGKSCGFRVLMYKENHEARRSRSLPGTQRVRRLR